MNNLFIIDAVNFLFRSYYAIGPMMNAQGKSTSALYGFIRSMQKLTKDFSPEHLVCVFDGPDNKKSRREVYADYKMHRKGAPEDLFPQFEWASKWCELAGISTLCVEGVEADDTMASVAVWAAERADKIYLCTSDKDLMQLVDDKIVQLLVHKDNLIVDTAKVEELFGVKPNQMLDYLAIVGDASDNIPGIEGFGPKTATALLGEFGTLDNLLAHPEKIKGEKKQEILRTQASAALMSRILATLDTNVPFPKEPLFFQRKDANRIELSQFYHQMNFNSLLRDLESIPEKKQHAEKQIYHLVDDEPGLLALLKKLSEAKEVGLDTETTSLSPMQAELVGIGFCIEPGEAWYVPCNGQLGKEKVLSLMKSFFIQAKCSFFGHNIKYDLHILQNAQLPLPHVSFDTLVASYLLNPQSKRHGLDHLALEKFNKVKIPIEQLIGKGKQQISMWDVPLELVSTYCCEDIDYTTRLKELFEAELATRKLTNLFSEIELPLLPLLAKMERTGIYLDAPQLEALGTLWIEEIEALKKEIFALAKEPFNLNSPKQLSQILFEKLQLKPPGRKKTEFSTGAEVLEELVDAHPIIPQILIYRSLEKLRSTYTEALPQAIDPKTGRIHCTFNQSVAATGRLSSQDPNLQNIPVRTPQGLAIRACFKPERKDWSYVGGDYSQIELRLLAHFSQDPELLKAFRSGEDIHAYTASLVYDIPQTMVTPEMRSAAKTVNFGILYGQGPFGLSKQLHISQREAADFIRKYFARYPKVQDFLEHCKAIARVTGKATTLMGRERPIPELTNQNPMIRAAAERLAINTPLQGTAADLIKLAMLAIDQEMEKRRLQGKIILQIHDELIFEVPDSEVPIFQTFVKEKMENVFQLKVPIEVHIAVGKNWAEC